MAEKPLKYRTQPGKILGAIKRTQICANNFSPLSRNQRLLLIGFDTEYQTIPGGTDNQVLSYQFSAEILDVDPALKLQSWSGIILPDSHDIKDRLSIPDFLSVVISEGIADDQDIEIPKNIYLFAHMSRADLPAFSEFKDDKARRTLGLENIRNTFVNVQRNLRCAVNDTKTGKQIDLTLLVRDTMHLAAGGKSLAAIGDLLRIKKVKLANDEKKEIEIKRNMLRLYQSDWKLFKRYALMDAVITHKYAITIIRLYQKLTGKFKFPLTLTSIGVDLLIKNWESERSRNSLQSFIRHHSWDRLSLVGREEHKERFWSKKHNRYIERRSTPLIRRLFWHEAIFTDGYHGGRNEQFWFGPLPEGMWYDYDLTSAYPSVMTLIGYPLWERIKLIKDTAHLLSLKHTDLAVANVSFKFPDAVRFPCLPVRTDGGLVFPRSGNTTTHISEILVAAALGAKIKLVEGRVVPSLRQEGLSGNACRPFLAFTQECVRTRRNYEKGTLENAFWKEMVNSTYGKTAQGLQRRRVYDLRDEKTKDLEPSKITNPFYASMITGFCRATLSEIMNALPRDVMVCSVTTDGFLTTASPAQMDDATSTLVKGFAWENDDYDFEKYPPTSCIGYYKEAGKLLRGAVPYADYSDNIYEVKHICRQPLGWRTRGQATIKPATLEDLSRSGLKKDDERYVLAKAGLKVGSNLTKPQENTEILELFFNRDADSVIEQDRLQGIKEMYEQGFDLAPYNTKISVSMEYDWKRRPVDEVDFHIQSLRCDHLQFQTIPWDDVTQYADVRSRWAAYTKSNHKCLKSVSALHNFNNYHASSLSLEDNGSNRYLRRDKGAVTRLRQQVSIAQALHRAGTHILKPHALGDTTIFPTYKLRAHQLTEMFTKLGIPCRKSDVDNGRRKAKKSGFIPHQVPRTEQTESLLNTLRQSVFPHLEVEQFLSPTPSFKLIPDQNRDRSNKGYSQ